MTIESLKKRFTDIYTAHADAIFRFCLVRVSDREQAIDITEETFMRLWRTFMEQEQNPQQAKQMHNPRAFLFTVAHHLIIDWYRTRKSVSLEAMAAAADDESFEPPDETSFASSPERLAVGAEGRLLLEKINTLESGDRQVLYLRFVEGLPPADIGAILGISANATSVRVNRALKKLRSRAGYDERSEHDNQTNP